MGSYHPKHKDSYYPIIYGYIKGIIIANDNLTQPNESFIPIYKKAADSGLVLKAHVGEWGSSQDIVKHYNISMKFRTVSPLHKMKM